MKIWILAGIAVFGLAGCGGGPPPAPLVYKPLNYSYLPPITLKVARVNVQNVYVPGPDEGTLIGEDPEAPANALRDMLGRRLLPSGAAGTANVTITVASLDESGGNLSGTMTVDVSLTSGDGHRTGFTEASVSHTETAPDSGASQEDVRAALYGITKALMEAMNVQLQYQLQHSLGDWIVYGNGVASVSGGGGIVATPLPGPGAAPAGGLAPGVAPAASGAPQVLAPAGAASSNALPAGSLPLGSLPLGTLPVGSLPAAPANGVSQ